MDKILILDDDQESRDLLAEVLAEHGFAPYAVEDAEAARSYLRSESDCRIVIADLKMPRESGLEFLRKLREAGGKHEVILMSSFMSGAEARSAQALGAYALLDKPFSLEKLLQTVAELVAEKPARIAVS